MVFFELCSYCRIQEQVGTADASCKDRQADWHFPQPVCCSQLSAMLQMGKYNIEGVTCDESKSSCMVLKQYLTGLWDEHLCLAIPNKIQADADGIALPGCAIV